MPTLFWLIRNPPTAKEKGFNDARGVGCRSRLRDAQGPRAKGNEREGDAWLAPLANEEGSPGPFRVRTERALKIMAVNEVIRRWSIARSAQWRCLRRIPHMQAPLA